MQKKQKRKLKLSRKKKISSCIIFILIVLISVLIGVKINTSQNKPEPEIISKSTLEKIINVNDLSTFEAKIITAVIPEIEINDINVDITSLDYIFINEKANTSTVSEQAYKMAIEDATVESASEKAIYELAEQNAHNIIEALLSPFIEQLDEEYQLVIS